MELGIGRTTALCIPSQDLGQSHEGEGRGEEKGRSGRGRIGGWVDAFGGVIAQLCYKRLTRVLLVLLFLVLNRDSIGRPANRTCSIPGAVLGDGYCPKAMTGRDAIHTLILPPVLSTLKEWNSRSAAILGSTPHTVLSKVIYVEKGITLSRAFPHEVEKEDRDTVLFLLDLMGKCTTGCSALYKV